MNYDVLEKNENSEIEKIGTTLIYNTDNFESLSDSINNSKSQEFFKMSFDSNNVYNSGQGVYFFNSKDKNNKRKIKIGTDNFKDCLISFSSRKLIKFSWINEYSEFLKPQSESFLYSSFENNSIIYSLFHNQNLVLPKNQFFWLSKSEMMELANTYNYTELYNDARTDEDRYVYKLLFGEEKIYDKLSPEAKDVLDTATELVKVSIPMRVNFADTTNHLNSWDAGYAQLKLLWKEFYPEQFKQFRERYKVLEDKMRPMVYELGFLLK